MKSFNTKLVLSALGIALLATPALAQTRHQIQRHASDYPTQYSQGPGTYPNGASRSGSAENVESGAEFNELR